MKTRLGVVVFVVLTVSVFLDAQHDGAISGVIVTFEKVSELGNGESRSLGTGTLYLTPERVGLWRLDTRRIDPNTGETFYETEIRTRTERITISHNLKNAVRGPFNVYWPVQSPMPPIIAFPESPESVDAADLEQHSEHDHDEATDPVLVSTRGYGPLLLEGWSQDHGHGTWVVTWRDTESGKAVVSETYLSDGSMLGERLRSAERTSFPITTFEVPDGYMIRNILPDGIAR